MEMSADLILVSTVEDVPTSLLHTNVYATQATVEHGANMSLEDFASMPAMVKICLIKMVCFQVIVIHTLRSLLTTVMVTLKDCERKRIRVMKVQSGTSGLILVWITGVDSLSGSGMKILAAMTHCQPQQPTTSALTSHVNL